ncbi:hypothetical protein ACFV3R_31065 [Streptomyces sp. NPDC059740]|uniref:hypothetical protein n=1 Tax=Streptomyces sp. NPDC059740 TaxID=3346926 RepID=UPI0036546A42
MVTFAHILTLDVDGLDLFSKRWQDVHSRIEMVGEMFHDLVVTDLHEEKWRGQAATSARQCCDRISMDIEALNAEVKGLRKFIDEEVNGASGAASFRAIQTKAREIQQEAVESGMRVDDDGSVQWATMYDPDDPESRRNAQMMKKKAEELQRRARGVIREADEEDQWMTQNLKVIFGTTHNFESENRKFGTAQPDEKDRKAANKLSTVGAAANARGWVNTAYLVQHYLDGTGKPVEIDPEVLLQDVPQFRRDSDKTLQEDVKNRPDGPFATKWQSTAPNRADGGKSLDYYYALNHFQYRMVGEKHGNKVTYHTEIKKRYDWGVPSEHRTTQSQAIGPFGITLEQADLAHLNTVGLARDFDVQGKSKQTTTTL